MDHTTRADDQRTEVPPRFTFGVSGHRDVVPENLPELRQHIGTVFHRFRSAYPNASHELLSPLAEGADRAAAELALSCGIKLVVPLPMAQPEYEQDFATPESLREFRKLLEAADSHFDVRGNDIGSNHRAEKYAVVGDYIARWSHVLILLWDGRDNEKIGGTAWSRNVATIGSVPRKLEETRLLCLVMLGQFTLLLRGWLTRSRPALRLSGSYPLCLSLRRTSVPGYIPETGRSSLPEPSCRQDHK